LSLVCNLTEQIHINKSKLESGLDFKSFFPSFVWVLWDFYLDLEGKTSWEYLEECLWMEAGYTEDIYKKNKIWEAITKYFVDWDCVTLIRPIAEESRLAHIEDEDFENLKSEFKKGANEFVKWVHSKAKPKIV